MWVTCSGTTLNRCWPFTKIWRLTPKKSIATSQLNNSLVDTPETKQRKDIWSKLILSVLQKEMFWLCGIRCKFIDIHSQNRLKQPWLLCISTRECLFLQAFAWAMDHVKALQKQVLAGQNTLPLIYFEWLSKL